MIDESSSATCLRSKVMFGLGQESNNLMLHSSTRLDSRIFCRRVYFFFICFLVPLLRRIAALCIDHYDNVDESIHRLIRANFHDNILDLDTGSLLLCDPLHRINIKTGESSIVVKFCNEIYFHIF
jgi:hypothetical protein